MDPVTIQDLLEVVNAKPLAEHPGPGWFTVNEAAKAAKLSRRAMDRRISDAVAAGTVDTCEGWVIDRLGRKQRVTYYRPKVL